MPSHLKPAQSTRTSEWAAALQSADWASRASALLVARHFDVELCIRVAQLVKVASSTVHDSAKRSSVRVFDPARQRRHSDQRGILETVLVTALNAVESVGILVHAGHAVQVWQRDTVPLACLDDVAGQATNESG